MFIYPDFIALVTQPFDPVEDAYKLKSIMNDGKYENLIIFYLSTIPNEWRQEIADVFFYDYGRDLTRDLQSLLSKDFHDLILAIMLPPTKYKCMILNHYLKGPSTDERVLLEILCTISKPEIAEIVEIYEIMYGYSLAEHMSSDTSDFRRLLKHIVTGARYEEAMLDSDRAWQAVLLLDFEGPASWGTDDGTFVKILAKESFSMIRLIFKMYKSIRGRTVKEAIRDEIDGDLKDAMSAIVNCIMNPSVWLARKLHDVMNGNDTDDNAIVRIIMGRLERDLVAINRAYDRLYHKTLQTAIGDFSEWKDTCSCLGNAVFRRFVSLFYKPRKAVARTVAKKILFYTIILDEDF